MPNDSPDWQAATDNGPIHLGELVFAPGQVSGSLGFALPATATGLCLLVRSGPIQAVQLEAVGFTSNYDYLQNIVVPATVTGPYFAPISGAFEGTVTVVWTGTVAQSATLPVTVLSVYALCGAGYSVTQAPPHQPDVITGTVVVTPNPLPVDPSGHTVGISGQPIGVTVNPNPLPVDASGHTVPVSQVTSPWVVSGTVNIGGQPISVTVNPNPLPVTGTVTVNENPRVSTEQRVQFNITTTTTIVAGVAGKVITLIGWNFTVQDAGGVFPSIGTWILWGATSHKVLAQGEYYAGTQAGLISQKETYRDADGKPPSLNAGEGLQLDVIPAGATTQQYLGFADFTQV